MPDTPTAVVALDASQWDPLLYGLALIVFGVGYVIVRGFFRG